MGRYRKDYTLQPRMTGARLAWLKLLANGPAPRDGHGIAGCHCMRLGWTEWLMERGGQLRPLSEVRAEYGGFREMWEAGWQYSGGGLETLTTEGRAVLAQAAGGADG